MSTVRILLEVASDGKRTPQDLADIAAGRLTSCLGVDQRVSDPVKGSVVPEWGVSGVYDHQKQSRLNGEMLARLAEQSRAAQNVRPLYGYDDLRNASPSLGRPQLSPAAWKALTDPPVKLNWWQKLLAWP